MVASDRRRVEHYQRAPEGWVFRTHAASEVLTTSAGVRVEVDALYRLV